VGQGQHQYALGTTAGETHGFGALVRQHRRAASLSQDVLGERARLGRSLQRQQRARLIIRMWRYIHIPLAYLSLLVIGFHSVIELWKMLVLHY